MIETFRDSRVIEAEITRQGRGRPAQVVWREGLDAEQRADAEGLDLTTLALGTA
jgi:hypothetical protein